MEIFRVEPDLVSTLEDLDEEGLLDFATAYENVESDPDIEVAIIIQFLLFTKSSSLEFLQAALQRATGWASATEAEDEDRSRRYEIVDMMLAVQLTHSEAQARDRRPLPQARPAFHVLSFEFIEQWLLLKDLWNNMRQSNDPGNLAILTSSIRQIMPMIPPGFQPIASWLSSIGIELFERFEDHQRIEDLECAVEIARMAVDAALLGSVEQAICLGNLGNCLSRRSEVLREITDRESAIDVFEKAIDFTPLGDPNRAIWQGTLASQLIRLFESTNLDTDLDRAVSVAEMAIHAMPQTHPNRATTLETLALCLGMKFNRWSCVQSLNRAIVVLEEASSLVPEGSSKWADVKASISTWLSARSHLTNSEEELNHAVQAAEEAVLHSLPGSQDYAFSLNSLGSCLSQRFERYRSVSHDLDRAIKAADLAIKTLPEAHPNRDLWSGNLANYFYLRFEQFKSMEDLDRAIELSERTVRATARDRHGFAAAYNNVAIYLCTRFEQIGNLEDITRAVEHARIAVDATPLDSPDWPGWSSNLGTCLGRRFERNSTTTDLNGAIDAARAAVYNVATDQPNKAKWLNNYGLWLHARFKRHRSLTDITNGIEAVKTAIDITADDNPEVPVWQSNLAVWLSQRAMETESIRDADEAVQNAKMSVEVTSAVHADRAARFNNLGFALWTRYNLTDSEQDRDDAITASRTAIDASSPEYPERAGHLENLGNWLWKRSRYSVSDDDQNQALSCYNEGWACSTAPPSTRISLARRAARIYAAREDWTRSSEILAKAMELLPLVSPRMLEQNEKQYMISRFNGMASSAAAAALSAGKEGFEALALLEQGRCVISGLLSDMRTDLSELAEQHPVVAAEFESLRDELGSPVRHAALSGKPASSLESQIDRRFEADGKLTKVIATIRTLPGFEGFLLPPTQDDLMSAANEGPIVIFNVNSYRCDAFIIQRERVEVHPLPSLTKDALDLIIRQSSVRLVQTLEWLWNVAVCPVLEQLHYTESPTEGICPRVWWIPTGALSHFPIHAAGLHLQRMGNTVVDRVMSSYSSSLKALVRSRKSRSRQDATLASDEALLIAMEATMHRKQLPDASNEISMLVRLCDSLQLQPVLPKSRKEEVLRELVKCKIFHFAGHGESDASDPSKSCILLEDWVTNPLTVGDLQEIRVRGNSPFLGYLSACSTSTNKANDLVDEGIHLVSAFQLAGFRHVIGTLWEVSDNLCVLVAKILYETLRDEGMTDSAVCHGLHLATRALRDSDVVIGMNGRDAEMDSDDDPKVTGDMSLHWVPYIHFGP